MACHLSDRNSFLALPPPGLHLLVAQASAEPSLPFLPLLT